MIKLIKPNKYETGFMHCRREEFLLDSADDINLLPKDCVVGSIAYLADMSASYRLSPSKEWKMVEESSSSSSGGGVAFIDFKTPTPTVWDAASGQFIPLTKERFVELFNSGIIRTVESIDSGYDPTQPSMGGTTSRATVVGYYINSSTATVGVMGTVPGGTTVSVKAWA